MKIALLIPPSSHKCDPSPFSSALSPAQRIERHLRKQGHRIRQFALQESGGNLFEIEEFIKVEDIDFTIAFGGCWALSIMRQQKYLWALFFSYDDVLMGDDKFNDAATLHSAKAIITDDLRAYHFLIKRLWLLKSKIHYIRKAVWRLSWKNKGSLDHFPLPANARWFVLNRDQEEISETFLDLFSHWHKCDPQIHLLAPLSDSRASSNRQIAKIVNRSGVVEIKEPSFKTFFCAIRDCLALIDSSSHPEESLVTALGVKMGKTILIGQKAEILPSRNGSLVGEKNCFMRFGDENDLMRLCYKADGNRIDELKKSNRNCIGFEDAQREFEQYKELMAKLFAN